MNIPSGAEGGACCHSPRRRATVCKFKGETGPQFHVSAAVSIRLAASRCSRPERAGSAHASSTTEWWYVNTHLVAQGRELSLFAAFFRIVSGKNADGSLEYAHSLTWAISDPKTGRYLPQSRVDEKAPRIGLEKIKQGHGSKDQRLNRAMVELLEKGKVPRPDRVFEGPRHGRDRPARLALRPVVFRQERRRHLRADAARPTSRRTARRAAAQAVEARAAPRRRRRRARRSRRRHVLRLRAALRSERRGHARRRGR